ncbi:MAG: DUF2520 domain-containing protein [Pedobacter sp.]|nr:DUF2520 domain-containing protein [Chitinophagaceae bacterium]
MEVVIIGTGNVATVLSKLIVAKGYTITQIVGREYNKALLIAEPIGAKANDNIALINCTADLYIIAVTDDAIASIATQLQLGDKLVVHTAGSISKDVLKNSSINYGVMWPLQTLRKEMREIPSIPFVVDANNEVALNVLEIFAKSLSPQCFRATDDERVKLHLAAVTVSNFTNHLFALAEHYCNNEGLDFKLLLPLINETVNRIQHHIPKNVQTGPAVRGDVETMETHLQLLNNYPSFQQIYQQLSNSIGNK